MDKESGRAPGTTSTTEIDPAYKMVYAIRSMAGLITLIFERTVGICNGLPCIMNVLCAVGASMECSKVLLDKRLIV